MKSWSDPTNWSRNLHTLIYRFNVTLPVRFMLVDLPVRWRNQHVMLPWPTLPFSHWLEKVFAKSSGQPMLGGHILDDDNKWRSVFSQFWRNFKSARGDDHDVYRDHTNELEFCAPIAIHAPQLPSMEMRGVESCAGL